MPPGRLGYKSVYGGGCLGVGFEINFEFGEHFVSHAIFNSYHSFGCAFVRLLNIITTSFSCQQRNFLTGQSGIQYGKHVFSLRRIARFPLPLDFRLSLSFPRVSCRICSFSWWNIFSLHTGFSVKAKMVSEFQNQLGR